MPSQSVAYTDVMVDLETVGTEPGSAIISIGAVAFSKGMPEADWRIFEVPVINISSSAMYGLKSDEQTMQWWSLQCEEARSVVDHALADRGEHVLRALVMFARYFPADARLWGNGADFDNVLLKCAYKATGLHTPWKYHNSRCYRTLKSLHPDVEQPAFAGVKHNALADALHQTRHWQLLMEKYK